MRVRKHEREMLFLLVLAVTFFISILAFYDRFFDSPTSGPVPMEEVVTVTNYVNVVEVYYIGEPESLEDLLLYDAN